MSLKEFAKYRSRIHERRRSERSSSSSSSTISSSSERRQKRKHESEGKDRHHKKHKKDEKYKKMKRKLSETSSSTESDNVEKKKKKSKHKHERKKSKKKKKKKEKEKKEHVKNSNSCQPKDVESTSKIQPAVNAEVQGPTLQEAVEQPRKRMMAPMTKEEYEQQQSQVRRVYDPDTGRNRLIKGDGEVIEEIVSYDRHKMINKMATHGDGMLFQANIQQGKYS